MLSNLGEKIMIVYDKLWQTMKEKNISQYTLITQYNESEKQCKLRLPDLKIVITGTKYGYRRDDGVIVVPIGCLKN